MSASVGKAVIQRVAFTHKNVRRKTEFSIFFATESRASAGILPD
jgi:hypothetical protein